MVSRRFSPSTQNQIEDCPFRGVGTCWILLGIVMRRTCFLSQVVCKPIPCSGVPYKVVRCLHRWRTSFSLYHSIALQARRSKLNTDTVAVAKPHSLVLKSAQETRRPLFSSDTPKRMAGAAPGSIPDAEGINRFKELFSGAMPKEEIGALSFLKVGKVLMKLWFISTCASKPHFGMHSFLV